MSIETKHLVLHLITPAEAQRIVSRTPGPEDTWGQFRKSEVLSQHMRYAARSLPQRQ